MRDFRIDRRAAPFTIAALLSCAAITLCPGCGGSPHASLAPVQGKVLYRGKPLAFGSVTFQPDKGPPAHGVIGSDGSFTLSTYGKNDGAALGRHRVQVTCFESQRPGATAAPGAELPTGKSLIPAKYLQVGTTDLTVEVKPSLAPLTLELKD